jgi:hypothetical protein
MSPYDRLDLTGKAFVVVGGADGLGRASAELVAARGGAVMVAGLNEANAKVVAEQIRATGAAAAAIQVDVSNEDQVAAVVEATIREFGRLDGARPATQPHASAAMPTTCGPRSAPRTSPSIRCPWRWSSATLRGRSRSAPPLTPGHFPSSAGYGIRSR